MKPTRWHLFSLSQYSTTTGTSTTTRPNITAGASETLETPCSSIRDVSSSREGSISRGYSYSRDSGDNNSNENISNCRVESSTRDNKSKSRDPINSKGPSIDRTHGKPTAALRMETAEATATSARAWTPSTAKTRQ